MTRCKGYERLGLDRRALVEMYDKLQTMERVADRIGVTSRTVRYWFKALGIEGHRNWALRAHAKTTSSAMARWIRANPGKKLPRNAREIAAATGLNFSTVSSYLTRRAGYVRRYVAALGDLRRCAVVFKDAAGKYVPTRSIKEYDVHVDRYTLELEVTGKLAGTTFAARVPVSRYRAWFEASPSVEVPALPKELRV